MTTAYHATPENDPAPGGERIPHLMAGDPCAVESLDPDDVDYSATTACGLDRNVTLVTSERDQVRCPACWKAVEDADHRAQGQTRSGTGRGGYG